MLLTKEKIYAILLFFACYQAIICWLLITLLHFHFVTFQKITWEIHNHSSYTVIFTYYGRPETKILFSRKKRFLFQDTRKFDCKAEIKMWEILFFSKNKVVLPMYKKNESGLIDQICGMIPSYHPHSKQANTPMEIPVWSANEKEKGDHCKIKH